MLTTRELQDEIIRLKKEKDICILAHAYPVSYTHLTLPTNSLV